MIQSMTGFGRIEGEINQKKLVIEIKSLNSKSIDLSIKMPHKFKDKELELRKLIGEKLNRGKVDFYLSIEKNVLLSEKKINRDQVRFYISELEEMVPAQPQIEYLKIAIKLPETITSEENLIKEEEDNWTEIHPFILKSLDSLIEYRNKEGEILKNELINRINNILKLLITVSLYDEERIKSIKTKIENKLEQLSIDIDKNRFEQELIYYIEKLDVTEEKLRLKSNCNYFLEELNNSSIEVGRKLGFITQEIGREINTLGSKSNHIEMQKIVVNMKDELEKIKEQLLNVL